MNISELVTIPNFGKLNVETFVGKPVLAIIFFVYLIGYIVLSSILFYHWRAYGMGSKTVIFAELLFVLVSIVLFMLTGLSLTLY